MRNNRIIVSGIVALSIASAAYAQEALKGEVVTVDKTSKKIGINLSGTVKAASPIREFSGFCPSCESFFLGSMLAISVSSSFAVTSTQV